MLASNDLPMATSATRSKVSMAAAPMSSGTSWIGCVSRTTATAVWVAPAPPAVRAVPAACRETLRTARAALHGSQGAEDVLCTLFAVQAGLSSSHEPAGSAKAEHQVHGGEGR